MDGSDAICVICRSSQCIFRRAVKRADRDAFQGIRYLRNIVEDATRDVARHVGRILGVLEPQYCDARDYGYGPHNVPSVALSCPRASLDEGSFPGGAARDYQSSAGETGQGVSPRADGVESMAVLCHHQCDTGVVPELTGFHATNDV